MEAPADVKALLEAMRRGDLGAGDQLYHLLELELRRIAGKQLARQDAGHTLQTTALVNEAWLRLAPWAGDGYAGRDHFLAVAAKAMRCILVDHARKKHVERRATESERVELDRALEYFETRPEELVALDEALSELARWDAELASIVELRFFAGLSHPEIARVLSISLRSVERGWRTARAWLRARLGEGDSRPPLETPGGDA